MFFFVLFFGFFGFLEVFLVFSSFGFLKVFLVFSKFFLVFSSFFGFLEFFLVCGACSFALFSWVVAEELSFLENGRRAAAFFLP